MLEDLAPLSGVKVLIIGDVMIDRYWWGDVNRISPEAPVPVVSLQSTSMSAGGAANVAANIAGLGSVPVLVGIAGDDAEAELLPGVLAEAGIHEHLLFRIPGRRTTLKTRIVAHNQQMARIDQETSDLISDHSAGELFERIRELVEGSEVVVLSDYAKGLLTPAFTGRIIEFARAAGKRVLVDPKGKDYNKYLGASILTPNQREAADACGIEGTADQIVNIAGKRLLEDLELEALLITQGERGMTLFERSLPPRSLRATARNVYNVTGAGDTAIGTMAAAMAGGYGYFEAAELANFAAGLVVEQLGTTPITREMLLSEKARFLAERQ